MRACWIYRLDPSDEETTDKQLKGYKLPINYKNKQTIFSY